MGLKKDAYQHPNIVVWRGRRIYVHGYADGVVSMVNPFPMNW
jgi:hypothetical protein